jgi:transposase InsO family protein
LPRSGLVAGAPYWCGPAVGHGNGKGRPRSGLIEQAIEMAARNNSLAAGAIFHTDRGSNYTSVQFARTLRQLGIRHSVGRTGICYDNAMAAMPLS